MMDSSEQSWLLSYHKICSDIRRKLSAPLLLAKLLLLTSIIGLLIINQTRVSLKPNESLQEKKRKRGIAKTT